MKNVTDFRKTVETGVDPRLQVSYMYLDLIWSHFVLICGYGWNLIYGN